VIVCKFNKNFNIERPFISLDYALFQKMKYKNLGFIN